MMRKAAIFVIAILGVALRAEIVDRMVAVVDGRVITWSAAVAEASYQAFLRGGEPVRSLEGEALRTVVSRLVDQELVQQEMSHSPFVRPVNDSAERTLEGFRKRFGDAAAMRRELERYGLSEAELVRRANGENAILGFVNTRLRPQAVVTREMIEEYYRGTLVPQLAARGETPAPALEEVSSQIEQVLIERAVNRLLEEWLDELRRGAAVKFVP